MAAGSDHGGCLPVDIVGRARRRSERDGGEDEAEHPADEGESAMIAKRISARLVKLTGKGSSPLRRSDESDTG